MPRQAASYAKKTIAFHMEFGSESLQNSRYEMITLYSLEHLQLANEALGRTHN